MNTKELQARFVELYKRPAAGAIRSPGRVNLIGEHTDYNDGFVLPMAIERQIVALYAPRKDAVLQVASAQAPETVSIDLTKTPARGEPSWANYPKGVVAGLQARKVKLVGADVLLSSDIPLGGGLSSSAALEVATAHVLLAVAGLSGTIGERDLALLCQKAEHEYALAPCGIMDQSIVIMGRAGKALLLDCRDGATRLVSFNDPTLVLLVADTQVKHAINDGGYAVRRQQCFDAAKKLGVKSLRDATAEMVHNAQASGKLSDKELMRARHVVGEIDRTVKGVKALEAGDYPTFGRLMYGSHESLAGDYEVSCEELDAIVASAAKQEGVFGARMTGGGFGGCAIVLAKADKAPQIIEAIAGDFAAKFGRRCPIFATHPADGAGTLKL